MNRPGLEDQKYEMIKAHVLDPDHTPLPVDQQELLDRVIAAAKILAKNPIQRHALAFHHQLYSHISKYQAYEDLKLAALLFHTLHTFDFEFWHTWMINDIVENILTCRKTKSDKDRRIIAMEHANLIKIIGSKPEELSDPRRTEKHQFYIMIQNNNQHIKVDPSKLQDLPVASLREINRAIYGGSEITETDAEEIMQS